MALALAEAPTLAQLIAAEAQAAAALDGDHAAAYAHVADALARPDPTSAPQAFLATLTTRPLSSTAASPATLNAASAAAKARAAAACVRHARAFSVVAAARSAAPGAAAAVREAVEDASSRVPRLRAHAAAFGAPAAEAIAQRSHLTALAVAADAQAVPLLELPALVELAASQGRVDVALRLVDHLAHLVSATVAPPSCDAEHVDQPGEKDRAAGAAVLRALTGNVIATLRGVQDQLVHQVAGPNPTLARARSAIHTLSLLGATTQALTVAVERHDPAPGVDELKDGLRSLHLPLSALCLAYVRTQYSSLTAAWEALPLLDSTLSGRAAACGAYIDTFRESSSSSLRLGAALFLEQGPEMERVHARAILSSLAEVLSNHLAQRVEADVKTLVRSALVVREHSGPALEVAGLLADLHRHVRFAAVPLRPLGADPLPRIAAGSLAQAPRKILQTLLTTAQETLLTDLAQPRRLPSWIPSLLEEGTLIPIPDEEDDLALLAQSPLAGHHNAVLSALEVLGTYAPVSSYAGTRAALEHALSLATETIGARAQGRLSSEGKEALVRSLTAHVGEAVDPIPLLGPVHALLSSHVMRVWAASSAPRLWRMYASIFPAAEEGPSWHQARQDAEARGMEALRELQAQVRDLRAAAVQREKERQVQEAQERARAEEEARVREAERMEAERKAEEARLLAAKQAEEERLTAAKRAEEERLAAEAKAEEERLEAEKRAEEARKIQAAREQERLEQLRLAREREEQERRERGRLEMERLQQQQAEQERLKRERLEQERLEKAQAEQERLEKEQAERERLEKEQAERERLEKEQAERKRLEKQQAEREELEKAQAEREELEKAQAEQERLEKEQAEHEQAVRQQAEKEQAEKRQAEKEQAEKEQAEKRQAEKERLDTDQAGRVAAAQTDTDQPPEAPATGAGDTAHPVTVTEADGPPETPKADGATAQVPAPGVDEPAQGEATEEPRSHTADHTTEPAEAAANGVAPPAEPQPTSAETRMHFPQSPQQLPGTGGRTPSPPPSTPSRRDRLISRPPPRSPDLARSLSIASTGSPLSSVAHSGHGQEGSVHEPEPVRATSPSPASGSAQTEAAPLVLDPPSAPSEGREGAGIVTAPSPSVTSMSVVPPTESPQTSSPQLAPGPHAPSTPRKLTLKDKLRLKQEERERERARARTGQAPP